MIISLVRICLLLLVKRAALSACTELLPKLASVILIATRMRRGIVHDYRLMGLARQYFTPSRPAYRDVVFDSPTVPFSYSN